MKLEKCFYKDVPVVKNSFKVDTIMNCSKCKEDISGVIYLDKKTLTVVDSWYFMLFSDGVVCDKCLGEEDGDISVLTGGLK